MMKPTKTTLRALAPVAALAAVLLTASCSGGAGDPQVAQGTAKPTNAQSGGGDPFQQALAYAKCMRAHGLSDFPDPQRSNGGVKRTIDKKILQNPQYKSAAQACQKLQPGNTNNGGGTKVDATKVGPWAQCIRDHGVPNFPDPKNMGNALKIDFTGTGIDPKSPQFSAAQKACKSKSPGGGLIVIGGGGS